MRELRLLFVIPFYEPAYIYGGPVRSVPTLCKELVSLGCEVTVYTTNANGKKNFGDEFPKFQTINGVRVHYFNRDLPGNYYYSRELKKACFATIEQFDLAYIISNWAYPFLSPCKAARSNSIPYVVTPRTSFMQNTWKGSSLKKKIYHYLFERRLINNATALHYTTALEVKESAWLKIKTDHFIVPNPVQLEEFKQLPTRGLFRRKYQISDRDHIILYLGRVEHRKGIDISLEAFARTTKTIPNSRFVIAGPDEDQYANTLKDMASKLGVTRQVLFTDYLGPSQRLEAFADADVFILTSYSENFGMAVVEAMACGLPVLISDQVGIANHIDQAGAGIITQLDSTIAAQKLTAMLKGDLHQRESCEENAKEAAKMYAPRKVAEDILNHFFQSL